jgi:hypothetical protein
MTARRHARRGVIRGSPTTAGDRAALGEPCRIAADGSGISEDRAAGVGSRITVAGEHADHVSRIDA